MLYPPSQKFGPAGSRAGLAIVALELVQYRQIADGCQGVWMLFAQHLFTELQGLFVQWLSLTVTPEQAAGLARNRWLITA